MKKIYLQILFIISFYIIAKSKSDEQNKIGINKKNLVIGSKIREEEIQNINNHEKDEMIQKKPSIYKSINDDKKQEYKAMVVIGHILSYISFFLIFCVIVVWLVHICTYSEPEYKKLDKDFEFNDFWKKSCAIFCYCCNR